MLADTMEDRLHVSTVLEMGCVSALVWCSPGFFLSEVLAHFQAGFPLGCKRAAGTPGITSTYHPICKEKELVPGRGLFFPRNLQQTPWYISLAPDWSCAHPGLVFRARGITYLLGLGLTSLANLHSKIHT